MAGHEGLATSGWDAQANVWNMGQVGYFMVGSFSLKYKGYFGTMLINQMNVCLKLIQAGFLVVF